MEERALSVPRGLLIMCVPCFPFPFAVIGAASGPAHYILVGVLTLSSHTFEVTLDCNSTPFTFLKPRSSYF